MAGKYQTADATAPAANGAVVVPSDDTTFPPTRSLYIGTGGDVFIDQPGEGDNIPYYNVPSGTVLPVQATRVYATGTTAQDINRMW
jgi:hypothetical protein